MEIELKLRNHHICVGFITGMDFNPEGTKMSLMYYSGDLVVSDVDDDACIFYFDTKQSKACNLNFTPLNGIQCDH